MGVREQFAHKQFYSVKPERPSFYQAHRRANDLLLVLGLMFVAAAIFGAVIAR